MNKHLGLLLGTFVGICILLCAGCGQRIDPPSAEGQMNPDVRHDQVRVVLLRAGPVALTTNQPTFVVTYGIGIPRQGAFSDLSISSKDEVTLVVRGKPIDYRGGGGSVSEGFSELPRQSELRKPALQVGRLMIFEDVTFTDLPIDAEQIDIRIRFSWRGTPQSFEFRNVPVGYGSAERGA